MEQRKSEVHLLADGIDVSAANPIGPRDIILEVHVFTQVHFSGDCREDESLLTPVGHRKLDLAVQTTRPQQRRIQGVCSVRCHYHLHSAGKFLLRLTSTGLID